MVSFAQAMQYVRSSLPRCANRKLTLRLFSCVRLQVEKAIYEIS